MKLLSKLELARLVAITTQSRQKVIVLTVRAAFQISHTTASPYSPLLGAINIPKHFFQMHAHFSEKD